MGRPPTRTPFKQERRHLAALIDHALKIGQRGDGSPKDRWHPWTEIELARKAGVESASTVSDWRDSENPSRPGNIIPLLKAFYGDIPAYAEAKAAMLKAWKRAAGIDSC